MSLLRVLPYYCCIIIIVVLFSGIAKCDDDVDKDKEKCANDLVGLATCLPYVSGEAESAPIDCCTGLKQVLQKSPKCICLLVKDRNDPSLGLHINATRALGLPSFCHAPANISDCPALLHLAPNSPDAKVFEDFANSAKKGNSTTSAPAPGNLSSGKTPATKAIQTGDGGKRKRWSSIGMFCGLFVTILFFN